MDIIDLRIASAEARLDMAKDNYDNAAIAHLESLKDFFKVFVTEEEALFIESQEKKEELRQIINNLPDNNPWKKFALAEIYLHSAMEKSKFGQLYRSAREIYKAYRLLMSNAEEHPYFIYNNKSLSVINCLAGTVTMPGLVKKIFDIDGKLEKGIKQLTEISQYSLGDPSSLFKEEIDAIYLYVYLYQMRDKKKTLEYLDRTRLDPKTSLLSTFIVTKVYERTGQNDLALATLESSPQSSEYFRFPYLKMMKANYLLRRLDDNCIQLYEEYISDFKGRHYLKEAYQKIAWSSIIFRENTELYDKQIQKIISQGHLLVDGDTQAQKEAESNIRPHPTLLKARLLYDGGYYLKAQYILEEYQAKQISDPHHTLEYTYRMGRISQALGNLDDAIYYYHNTIDSQDNTSYYSCNAALQAGIIYEQLKDHTQARKHYNLCLSINATTYRKSLHQKAKSGLHRLSLQNPK